MLWGNLELDGQHRASEGLSIRYFAGFGYPLAVQTRKCTSNGLLSGESPCTAGEAATAGGRIGYVGVALGGSF